MLRGSKGIRKMPGIPKEKLHIGIRSVLAATKKKR